MRCGLYFGSFNPMHIGHIAIAKYLIQNAALDKVMLVVSPHNPLKNMEEEMSAQERLKQVRNSIEKYSIPVEVSDIEFNLPKPLYTINTLLKFQELEPENQFILIIGADNLAIIDQWHEYEKILSMFDILVYPRSGFDGKELCEKYGVTYIDAPLFDISSTQIRELEAKGKDMSKFKA